MGLLDDILIDTAGLDAVRGERGMVAGRRTSTPLSRRAPADLDVLVLTDPRTGVLAVLSYWAGRIRHQWPYLPRPATRSVRTESETIDDAWGWALQQPWGASMVEELEALESRLHQARYGVPVKPCPVCREPVRVDRFVRDHRACLDTPVG